MEIEVLQHSLEGTLKSEMRAAAPALTLVQREPWVCICHQGGRSKAGPQAASLQENGLSRSPPPGDMPS